MKISYRCDRCYGKLHLNEGRMRSLVKAAGRARSLAYEIAQETWPRYTAWIAWLLFVPYSMGYQQEGDVMDGIAIITFDYWMAPKSIAEVVVEAANELRDSILSEKDRLRGFAYDIKFEI